MFPKINFISVCIKNKKCKKICGFIVKLTEKKKLICPDVAIMKWLKSSWDISTSWDKAAKENQGQGKWLILFDP